MTRVLAFGDVATGWFEIQERGGEETVMEGERASCPQPVTFSARAPVSLRTAQHGHRAKANHAHRPIMLQTYGEAWLQKQMYGVMPCYEHSLC